ncbi:hypothetical protein ABRQ22_06655 [Cellulosimicrobium sp. ES-005]|uniref:Uncharacterized protein n=1 Tax=Cellulosimicrobium sp. ES-005 TaxID=3163031 RepID=A0AAU8G6M1_9MICO
MTTALRYAPIVAAVASVLTFVLVLVAFIMWRAEVSQAEYDERFQACMASAPPLDPDDMDPYLDAATMCHESLGSKIG